MDANFNAVQEIAIDSDFGNFAKKTLAVSDTEDIVSEGSKGAGIYDKSNGSMKEYLSILINSEGVAQSDIVTNAFAINDNVLLMANGGAGPFLSEKQGNGTDMVDSGATLRIEGDLAIYGDFILNDGAILEFVGGSSLVNIFGDVKKSNSAEVIGEFKDVKNKF